MLRKIKTKVKGYRTVDGAGVSLVRVLGGETVKEFDPILMLDSFDSQNPEEYTAGFPMHPHRGIETISYVYEGKMVHSDNLGNKEYVSSGEVQWMTAGSGILHEELVPASDRLLGVQLWLNLPKKDKMVKPDYKSITKDEIEETAIENGKIRLLAGKYKEHQGYMSKYLPLDYYDIHLDKNSKFEIETEEKKSIMLFTLVGSIVIDGEKVSEKTAVKLTEGSKIEFSTEDEKAQVLFISSDKLDEPIAWAGPIVMNTQEELVQASIDLRTGNFIK